MAQALQADFLLSGVLNQSGQPNSGGWAIFYESDGSTLKSVFADSEKAATKTLNSNNGVDLDLNGSATVFLDGTYTVKIYDKNGVLLRTFSSLQFNPQDASSADYIEAKNYGSSNDGTRISLAVSDAAGADRTVYLAPANYAITSNLTIPSNINLKFEMGAFLTVSSGITVTINGSIEAPLYNIFRGSGTTTFDDRNNVVPSVWSSGTHDNLTLDGVVNVSDTLQLGGVSVTSTAAELNILDGVTATASELNILDGVTSTASELNLLDGSAAATIANSKAVIYGSSGEILTNKLTVQQSVNYSVVSKTSTYTAADESVILVDASSGAVTINLPTASGLSGRQYTITKTDSSVNNVLIDANSSETINGNSIFYLAVQYEKITLICTGSQWIVVGANFDIFSTGQIISWPGTSVPSYALECNGANVSRSTYARLFAKVGTTYGIGDGSTTFGLPDYRGRFLRGFDNTAGTDPDASSRTDRGDGTTGDAVGTKQLDAMQGHHHTQEHTNANFQFTNTPSTGSVSSGFLSGSNTAGSRPSSTFHHLATDPYTDGTNGTPRTSSETRSKNINIMYCIKL